MKTSILLTLISITNVSFAQFKLDSDLNKTYSCNACHGDKGISPNDEWPNLAGQKKTYLVEQLKKFKSGERINPLMTPMALTLSDSEMERLAEYFSKMGAP